MANAQLKIAVGAVLMAGVLLAGGGSGTEFQAGNADAGKAAAAKAEAASANGGNAEARKRLSNPDPQVRLKAALRLAGQVDEQAINVLIELLAVLPAPERRQAERALQVIAEEWSPTPALAGDDEISRRILCDAWAGWWRNTDGQALLAAFKKRTLTPDQTTQALSDIVALDDNEFATRERAAAQLVKLGAPVVPLLRQARPGTSLEQSRRIAQCIQQIANAHATDRLPAVAARLLALRKPAGATATLLAYAAFTEDDVMQAEVTEALHRLAGLNAQPDASLVEGLHDALPVRRTLAGEVLAAVADSEVRAAVRKLLADPDRAVRLRVAVALACAADRDAVPVLIDLLADGPADQVWQAEEMLRTVAGGKGPTRWLADDAAERRKARDAWRTWYAAHGGKLRLVPQPLPPPLLGFTTITAFSPPPDRTRSRVIEVDRLGKLRWQFTCHYPVDVHVLGHNRVLLTEMEARRITERDFKGNIHWQVDLPEPFCIQRLPGGNTFVVCRSRLLELDSAGKTVFDQPVKDIVAARKLPDGQIVYLTGTSKCVRLEASGKPVRTFDGSGENGDCACVLDLTGRGSLLVSQCGKNTAEEFDLEGNSLWRTPGPVAPGVVTEVRNGHLMLAIFTQGTVAELDRSGKTVWRYEVPGYNPFLARKR
jgi:HEAT repeat protein